MPGPVTAQIALRSALRDVLGPAARSHGYRGTAPTWRRMTGSGDWSVVNVQSSTSSSAERVRCVVNLAFAPEPWLRHLSERLGAHRSRQVSESLGLYRERLHPAGSPPGKDTWWEITDEASARAAVGDMVVQLDRAGWPVLAAMEDPAAMLDRVRGGELGAVTPHDARAEALLLMDAGPSAALDAALHVMRSTAEPRHAEWVQEFEGWVRDQARRAGPG